MELTFGQKAVGLTFNPANDDKVAIAKQKCADVIDQMNDLRSETQSQEQKKNMFCSNYRNAVGSNVGSKSNYLERLTLFSGGSNTVSRL